MKARGSWQICSERYIWPPWWDWGEQFMSEISQKRILWREIESLSQIWAGRERRREMVAYFWSWHQFTTNYRVWEGLGRQWKPRNDGMKVVAGAAGKMSTIWSQNSPATVLLLVTGQLSSLTYRGHSNRTATSCSLHSFVKGGIPWSTFSCLGCWGRISCVEKSVRSSRARGEQHHFYWVPAHNSPKLLSTVCSMQDLYRQSSLLLW